MEGKKVFMALFILAAAVFVVGCAEPADTQPLPQEQPGEPIPGDQPVDEQPMPGDEPGGEPLPGDIPQ